MNTQSYTGRRHPDNCDHDLLSQIGDFAWSVGDAAVEGLLINAPRIDGTSRGVVYIPVQLGPNSPGKHWGWDGNRDRPTLTPSIHWLGHWHGYLTSGQLKSC